MVKLPQRPPMALFSPSIKTGLLQGPRKKDQRRAWTYIEHLEVCRVVAEVMGSSAAKDMTPAQVMRAVDRICGRVNAPPREVEIYLRAIGLAEESPEFLTEETEPLPPFTGTKVLRIRALRLIRFPVKRKYNKDVRKPKSNHYEPRDLTAEELEVVGPDGLTRRSRMTLCRVVGDLMRSVKLPTRIESEQAAAYHYCYEGMRPMFEFRFGDRNSSEPSFEELTEKIYDKLGKALINEWTQEAWMAILNCVVHTERYRLRAFRWITTHRKQCTLCGKKFTLISNISQHSASSHEPEFNIFDEFLIGKRTQDQLPPVISGLISKKLPTHKAYRFVFPGATTISSFDESPRGIFVLNLDRVIRGGSVDSGYSSSSSSSSSDSSSCDSSSDSDSRTESSSDNDSGSCSSGTENVGSPAVPLVRKLTDSMPAAITYSPPRKFQVIEKPLFA